MSSFALRGTMTGHNGWVTSIAVPSKFNDVVISSSRDKSIIIWKVTNEAEKYAIARKRLVGHGHYVQEITVTDDGNYVLSGSWDGTLRLWNLNSGKSTRFVGHSKDVLSVDIYQSEANTKIVSASRDKTIKLWNTYGRCITTFAGPNAHKEWVSCVRFTPPSDRAQDDLIVSAGWDKTVKVWNSNQGRLHANLMGHTGYLQAVTISPDSSLCASGGKDGNAILWDLKECKDLVTMNANDVINALVFSPTRYWLCAATASSIIIWDLETRVEMTRIKLPQPEEVNEKSKAMPVQCISLAWNASGSILYAGYTDNVIRAYAVSSQ